MVWMTSADHLKEFLGYWKFNHFIITVLFRYFLFLSYLVSYYQKAKKLIQHNEIIKEIETIGQVRVQGLRQFFLRFRMYIPKAWQKQFLNMGSYE
jgi:hypothetical protein